MVTLVVDLMLCALVMSPLRKLATLIGASMMHPGQRAVVVGSGQQRGDRAVADAFNTMLDRIETERRESGRRALAAQESERLRIAHELHDKVGQTLTAVAPAGPNGGRRVLDGPQAPALREIAETVHHSLEDVRSIARELRPEALDDLGLINA